MTFLGLSIHAAKIAFLAFTRPGFRGPVGQACYDTLRNSKYYLKKRKKINQAKMGPYFNLYSWL